VREKSKKAKNDAPCQGRSSDLRHSSPLRIHRILHTGGRACTPGIRSQCHAGLSSLPTACLIIFRTSINLFVVGLQVTIDRVYAVSVGRRGALGCRRWCRHHRDRLSPPKLHLNLLR
jgi:hypothetical protein